MLLTDSSILFQANGMMAEVGMDQIQAISAMKYNEWSVEARNAEINTYSHDAFTGANRRHTKGTISNVGTQLKKGDYLVIQYITADSDFSEIVINGGMFSVASSFAEKVSGKGSIESVIQL